MQFFLLNFLCVEDNKSYVLRLMKVNTAHRVSASRSKSLMQVAQHESQNSSLLVKFSPLFSLLSYQQFQSNLLKQILDPPAYLLNALIYPNYTCSNNYTSIHFSNTLKGPSSPSLNHITFPSSLLLIHLKLFIRFSLFLPLTFWNSSAKNKNIPTPPCTLDHLSMTIEDQHDN